MTGLPASAPGQWPRGEMADVEGLKPSDAQASSRFESGRGYQPWHKPCQHPDDPKRFGVFIPREVIIDLWGFTIDIGITNGHSTKANQKNELRTETLFYFDGLKTINKVHMDKRLAEYLRNQEFDPNREIDMLFSKEGVMYFYAH